MPVNFLSEHAFGEQSLLLAVDLGTVIQAMVVIVPVVFWVLSQVLGDAQAKKPPVRKPRQPKPVAKNRPPDLTQEIESFLRRAAERRQGKPPADVEVLVPPTPVERRRVRPTRPVRAEVVAAELVQSRPVETLTSRHEVAEHVRQHLDTDAVTDHATRLGEEVGLADDKLDARLRKKFDHQLGNLRQQDSMMNPYARRDEVATTTSRSALTAATLAEILGNPHTAQQAVILSEILRRPRGDE
ncbi:MAG: hypothetical protein ACC645_22485 [Pirellulales bacterium]